MFKKSLAAVAVLGAFAGTALAADVQLYGLVDYGFHYTETKTTGADKVTNFDLKSGQNSGSRFGLKGVEDLGNGYKVGFVLENAFNADDGTLDAEGRLFHRESLLFVQSAWGELSFGRTGALDAGTGRYNLMGTGASAMGTGWGNVGKSNKVLLGTGDRMDNTVTYKSPAFAGVTVFAQGSFKQDNVDADDAKGLDLIEDDEEGSSDANRYYALGVTYKAAGLSTGFVASQTDYKRDWVNAAGGNKANDDAQAYSAFVNYDFGFVKPMLAVQYFDKGLVTGKKGYGVVVGATAPVLGGTLKATAGWADAEMVDHVAAGKPATDYKNTMVGVGYEYPLSKRTYLYTAAGYLEEKTEATGSADSKKKTTEVMAGLVHKF